MGDGLAVVEFVDRYERLLVAVTAARAGFPTAPAALARCAVAALATTSVILDGLAVERWRIMGAGLAAGAVAWPAR